tara:strand:+ start:25428 stop:25751 length:324 start_codon:yes stop_codon:yes gene_type:complete
MNKFITSVFITALLCLFSNTTQAKVKGISDRDAVRIYSDGSNTNVFFDSGRICESNSENYASPHCSNWDVNYFQAKFFINTCQKHSDNKDICKTYQSLFDKKKWHES